MKAAIDWNGLCRVLAAWGIILAVVAVWMAIMLHRQSAADHALEQAQQRWQESRQQFKQYASYQPDISFYLAHRETWQKTGLTQIPNLDQWASAWTEMQQQFSLPHLEYEIHPSVSCAGASCRQYWPFKQVPAFNVMVTPVHFKWLVDHESAVIPWLQHLRTEFGGAIFIRQCQWRLAEDAKKIAAECDLNIFNFPDVLPMPDVLSRMSRPQ